MSGLALSEQAERRVLEVLIQHPEQLHPGQLEQIWQGLESGSFKLIVSQMITEDLASEDLAARLGNQLPDQAELIEELSAAPLPVLFETDLPRYCRGVIHTAIRRSLEQQKTAWLGLLRIELDPKRQLKYQKRIVKLDSQIYAARRAYE